MTDIPKLARSLSEAQRQWVMNLEPKLGYQPSTVALADLPDAFIEARPPEYDDGCLVYPGEKIWLGGHAGHSPAGSTEWVVTTYLNETGLQVRAYLESQQT